MQYDRIMRYDGIVCGMSCLCICQIVRDMSCLCFAEMSTYFHFGKFQANSICPMFREGHAEFLYDFDACTHFYNQFAYYCRAGVHDGQWNDGGQVVVVGGAGHERK